jgi:hypothetical protein
LYQVGSVLPFLKDAAPDRRFEFYKSGQLFIRTNDSGLYVLTLLAVAS